MFWIKRIKSLFHNVIINSNANLTNSIAIANAFNKYFSTIARDI